MSKRPAFQFYPGDWRTDPGLRLCSLTARGLWIEMMAIMHEGEPYGHLTMQGRAISADMLARLVGESAAATRKALKDLEDNCVFSRTEEAVIFSRRMVRDEDIRNARSAGGSLGKVHGAKGASHGTKGGRPRKEKPPLAADVRGVILPPPSTSSPSPSSFVVINDDDAGAAIDVHDLADEIARQASVRHIDPARIAQHVDLIREWIGMGASADDIRAAVGDAIASASTAIHSLRYFDGAIRLVVAKRENSHGTTRNGSAAERSSDEILRAAAARRARRRSGEQG